MNNYIEFTIKMENFYIKHHIINREEVRLRLIDQSLQSEI